MNKSSAAFVLPSRLQDELGKCKSLPSIPAIALKIVELSENPDIGLGDVANVLSGDPALAAKLLKVVNSPMYSQRRAVNNLREALTLVGLNAALSISLSFSFMGTLRENELDDGSQENYWKRSVLSASISRLIGSRLGLYKIEDLFLASLLQDIGVLALESIPSTPYIQKNKKGLKHTERISLEENKMGVDHSVVGAWLLEFWGLPEKIITAVRYSHSLYNNVKNQDEEANFFHYCVNLSGSLADIWLDETPPELFEVTRDAAQIMLGFDNNAFNSLIVEINSELPKIAALFDVDLNDEITRGQLLDEAREITLNRSIGLIKQAEESKRNIVNIERRVQSIEEESKHDHLTQAYNRKHIDNLLKEEFVYANSHRWPLSLAFIDIDKFKEINDAYGHLFGDSVLQAIAKFFSANIRESDVLARYGGDEFILMLPGAATDTSTGMLNRLINLLGEELKLSTDGKLFVPTVSIGLATHMDKHHFSTLEQFIQAADEALYKAKDSGRNCLGIY